MSGIWEAISRSNIQPFIFHLWFLSWHTQPTESDSTHLKSTCQSGVWLDHFLLGHLSSATAAISYACCRNFSCKTFAHTNPYSNSSKFSEWSDEGKVALHHELILNMEIFLLLGNFLLHILHITNCIMGQLKD